MGRDVVGVGLDVVIGVAHSHADAGADEHFEVVAAVAEGHRLADVDAVVLADVVDGRALVVALADAVGEERMPTEGAAPRENFAQDAGRLFGGEERDDLHDVHRQRVLDGANGRHGIVEQVPHTLCVIPLLVPIDAEHLLVGGEDDGHGVKALVLYDAVDDGAVDALAEDGRAVAQNARSTIRRNDAVVLQRSEVVDERIGAAGGDKHLHAHLPHTVHGLQRRGRNLVSGERHKCAVNIEEYGFDHD